MLISRNQFRHDFVENPLNSLYSGSFGYFYSILVSETHSEHPESIYLHFRDAVYLIEGPSENFPGPHYYDAVHLTEGPNLHFLFNSVSQQLF